MYEAHLRIAYTKGKEEKKIKTKLKHTCHNDTCHRSYGN